MFFKKNNKKKEFKDMKELLAYVESLEKRIDDMAKDLEFFMAKEQSSFKKIGFLRFNPFEKTGGDQSFALALLDENNNGVIITSIYTREGNRVYAKPIEKGESKYSLCDEEKEAIKQALAK